MQIRLFISGSKTLNSASQQMSIFWSRKEKSDTIICEMLAVFRDLKNFKQWILDISFVSGELVSNECYFYQIDEKTNAEKSKG